MKTISTYFKNITQIAQEYFNISVNNVKNITINPCSSGDVNTSYTAAFNGEKVYIKIQDKSNLPALYKGQIEREVTGLKLCEAENIPCPKVLAYDFEQKYIITEYLNYKLLSQVWKDLSQKEKLGIKQSALDIIKKINGIKSYKFGAIYPDSASFDNWRDCYVYLMDTAVKDCLNYKTLDTKEADIIQKTVGENAEKLPRGETACLNHLDFHWSNIFVKESTWEIVGIIDFGSALYTPGYMDLFRLDGGFLYGTESFYKDVENPLKIDKNQALCADLFNTMDYFVFLSFTNQENKHVKNRILELGT